MAYDATEHHLYGVIVWEGQHHQCQGVPSLLLQAIKRGYIETELPEQIYTGKRGPYSHRNANDKQSHPIDNNIDTLWLFMFYCGGCPHRNMQEQWPKLIEAHLHLLNTLPVPNDLQTDLDYQATCEAIGIQTPSFLQRKKITSQM